MSERLTESQFSGYTSVVHGGRRWYGIRSVNSPDIVSYVDNRCPWCDSELSLNCKPRPDPPPGDHFLWLYQTYACGTIAASTPMHIMAITEPTAVCKMTIYHLIDDEDGTDTI